MAIPESISAGLRHKLTDDVTVLAGATYSRWSRFESLDIYGRDSSKPLTQAKGGQLTYIPEEWSNTWQLNVGGIWQATPEWAFKAGYAWDESPVDKILTARIPSSDRHWLTLGTQWKDVQSGWAVDAAVGTLLFDKNPSFTERNYEAGNSGNVAKLPTGAEDPSSFSGKYDLSAWSASIQVSKAF